MVKAYKYKLRRPSKAFVAKCESALEVCRELYNAALQERIEAWQRLRKSVSFADQCAQLPEIKPLREDVAGVHSQVLQATLRRLQRSFENFFRRVKAGDAKAGFPRFKSRLRFDSFTFPQANGAFRLEGDKLYLSKIGSCRVRLSREINGTIKTCTIKREADGWYIILTAEVEAKPLPKTGATVGLDVGLENFATLSNGETIPNPRHLKAAEKRLKTAQRAVSRKKRRGANRRKAVQLLAKHHLKVKRQRQDFAHKTSLNLLQRFDEIAVEDLNIKGMVKNHHLAKSISDVAWGTFLSILDAKAGEAGRRVWKVPAPYTSQECSGCGHRMRKTLAQREHRCSECGLQLHRDHNAAINIKGRAFPLGMSLVGVASEPRISAYNAALGV
jgi:putative transposase